MVWQKPVVRLAINVSARVVVIHDANVPNRQRLSFSSELEVVESREHFRSRCNGFLAFAQIDSQPACRRFFVTSGHIRPGPFYHLGDTVFAIGLIGHKTLRQMIVSETDRARTVGHR